MDLSRNKVFFFIVVEFYLGKVVPCDLPSGKRLECGKSVSSRDDCPKTCCYSSAQKPNCYFQENAYGPIRHFNGLCVNVRDGSHNTGTSLIWSRDCTSRNAFFLVSQDHPPFHVASGKCVLPNGQFFDPGDTNLIIKNNSNCMDDGVAYRPTENGNLKYYYLRGPYENCIGSKSAGSPQANDLVYISAASCKDDKVPQDKLCSYVYQRKFSHRQRATFQCYLGRTIKVIWANYGVQASGRCPLAISSSDRDCVTRTATNVVKKNCDGKTKCEFTIRDDDFLQSPCRRNPKILLVRYTCKVDVISVGPNHLNVMASGQNELLIDWSTDANKNSDVKIKFEICWKEATKIINQCYYRIDSSKSYPRKTLYELKPATKYNITLARYSCDGNTIGIKKHKIAITRSAALLASCKISTTSFEIRLGKLQSDDIYAQIVVSKLQSDRQPSSHPGRNLHAYDKNTVDNTPYIAAELHRTNLSQVHVFTVGDGKKYERYSTTERQDVEFVNVKLESGMFYSVFQRTFKSEDLYYDSDWMDVIQTEKLPSSTTPSTSPVIVGVASGTGVLLIVLLIHIIIFIRRRRRDNGSNTDLYDNPLKYQSSKQNESQNEGRDHQSNPSSDGYEETLNVVRAPSSDVYANLTETRSLRENSYQGLLKNHNYVNWQVTKFMEEIPNSGRPAS